MDSNNRERKLEDVEMSSQLFISSMDTTSNSNNRKRKLMENVETKSANKKRRRPNDNRDFEYGNYDRYYGYRNLKNSTDPRVEAFATRKELFENKIILDIGCNIGHVTYLIARDFSPQSILGIDLDNQLIGIARKNLRFYCNLNSPGMENMLKEIDLGSVSSQSIQRISNSHAFPYNVSFLHDNYMLHSDEFLAREEPKYNVILCLSVTKWIHLNWGDDSLKRTFRRIFAQLFSGGVLILEPQPYKSYLKKKISSRLRQNRNKLRFKPHMFRTYLLNEVGFERCETLDIPSKNVPGFERPIEFYFKA